MIFLQILQTDLQVELACKMESFYSVFFLLISSGGMERKSFWYLMYRFKSFENSRYANCLVHTGTGDDMFARLLSHAENHGIGFGQTLQALDQFGQILIKCRGRKSFLHERWDGWVEITVALNHILLRHQFEEINPQSTSKSSESKRTKRYEFIINAHRT